MREIKKKGHGKGLIAQAAGFLRAPRTAAVLIGATLISSFLGFLIPQQKLFEEYGAWKAANPVLAVLLEKTGLTSIYTSWWFISFLTLTGVSIVLCMISRLKTVFRFPAVPSGKIDGASPQIVAASPVELEAGIQKWLQKRGFIYKKTASKKDVAYQATTSWMNKLSSIVFHASLILTMLGFAYGQLYTFEGHLLLAEGETAQESAGAYLDAYQGPLFDQHSGFFLKLNSVHPAYQKKTLTDLEVDVTLIKDRARLDETIKVNYPLYFEDYKIVMTRYGPAPLVRVNKNGLPFFEAFIKLGEKKSESVFEDSFAIPEENLRIELEISPLSGRDDPLTKSSDYQMKIAAVKEGGSDQAVLKAGQSFRFDSYEISFSEVRFWARLLAVKDPGIRLVYFALFLASLSIMTTFLLPKKSLSIKIKSKGEKTEIRAYYRQKDLLGKTIALPLPDFSRFARSPRKQGS